MSGKTFFDYKEIILTKVIQNENLLKALTINCPNFLDKPLAISPNEAIYQYIYPYAVHPDTLTEEKSIITMRFSDFNYDGVKFKEGRVYFYTICHESIIITEYGNRFDYIYNQLFLTLNDSTDLGVGKAKIINTSDLSINKQYMGNVCCLEISDFR
jgi:hypothetical protein